MSDDCEKSLNSSADVIISLYKFEKYKGVLEQSIESCFNNLRVTFHFVLVSGSDDEIDWLKSLTRDSHHQVHLVEKRIGIYQAWNLAIKRSSGQLITNLNADDLRLPHSICRQAAALQGSISSGSYGNFILSEDLLYTDAINSEERLISDLGRFDLETLVYKSQNNMHCAPMWRREIHSQVGMFNESFQSSGDTDFWLRAMLAGATFINFRPVTVVYFYNPEGLSSTIDSSGRKEWRQIRDAYLRQAS
jgi:glycosyltransferase involved in cell wall biosynthesis